MRRRLIPLFFVPLLLTACSPRDFLTRRLAADLIEASAPFRAMQQLQLNTGIVSSDYYNSPEVAALQHHGWLAAANAKCPAPQPQPCFELTLTPAGVEAFQPVIPAGDTDKKSFTIFAARRELFAVTGIARQGNSAEVEFTWHWNPFNEVGAAVYHPDQRYRSTAAFRLYDDGWRIANGQTHPAESMEDSLKNSEPLQ